MSQFIFSSFTVLKIFQNIYELFQKNINSEIDEFVEFCIAEVIQRDEIIFGYQGECWTNAYNNPYTDDDQIAKSNITDDSNLICTVIAIEVPIAIPYN